MISKTDLCRLAVILGLMSTRWGIAADPLDAIDLNATEFGAPVESPTDSKSNERTVDFGRPINGIEFGTTNPLNASPFGSQFGSEFGLTEPKVTTTVVPQSAGVGEIVSVSVRIDLPEGSHTYPINDAASSTSLVLAVPPSLEAIDERFVPDREPEIKNAPGLGLVDQYERSVTWSKRFRVVSATNNTATIEGRLNYQVCDTLCKPYEAAISSQLAIQTGRFDSSGGYSIRPPEDAPVTFQFELVPPQPSTGEEVTLAITMIPDAGWHGFSIKAADGQTAPPTTIELSRLSGLAPLDEAFVSSTEPEVLTSGETKQAVHAGVVTWQRRFEATGEGPVALEGNLTFRLCDDGTICLPPATLPFSLGPDQAPEAIAQAEPMSNSYVDRSIFRAASDSAVIVGLSLWQQLGLAFLGGLILNVMPCVLPVLAIKVMGFVQQAGESRGRILALNLVYSLGVIGVFAVLGLLAVRFEKGFGEQFQSIEFTIVMSTVVTVAALSLLGVFEIPIPGFLGNAGAEQQEGLTGAFFTGVMATLLATPCTGPFIGPVVYWALQQPPHINFSIWLMMGAGMSSPYLIAGFYPKIIEFLPRPGMWMVYFKQVAGFILLGTVIWLMRGIPEEMQLPFLMAMVGISFGCWMIGTFRPHEPFLQRWPIPLMALVVAGGISFTAYRIAQPAANELPWQPFSSETLESLLADGEPVLIDFTADWCLICKQNESLALNTEETTRFINRNGVHALYADFTRESPEIKSWLERFGQSGVPLTVVYPRGGGSPVMLRGPYTQSKILDALEKAVSEDLAANSSKTRTR